MTPLEERLGYAFRDPQLLSEALTHPSLACEVRGARGDNQRLEFLGDAVLELVLTEHLYLSLPAAPEGALTKLRSRLVSRTALGGYASGLGLGESLQLGRGEEASGGRERLSALADAFEAVMGAIYLDGGLAAAREVITRVCADEIAAVRDEPDTGNPKGELQEILQGMGAEGPDYRIVAEGGPDHEKRFAAVADWRGRELGRGIGPSKKVAETEAARSALRERLWEEGWGRPADRGDQGEDSGRA